jgi:hypothetical protein
VWAVAAVTLANGGDNIGVYVPVFTTTGPAGLRTYTAVFLVLVAVWCLAGHFFARRPPIARALSPLGTHPAIRRPDQYRTDHPHQRPRLQPLLHGARR